MSTTFAAGAFLAEAESSGVNIRLDGQNLAVRPRPSPDLLDRIRAHNAAIMAELARRQSIPAVVVSPPAPAAPPMSQAPLGVSRSLAQALALAAHHHIQFWHDEAGLLITLPPRDYKAEIQAAERAIMAARDEIKMICGLPERPKHYEDQAWVRAVADSARLGYRAWKEG